MIRRVLFWLVFNVPLGPLAPWIFGLAIGRRPHRVKEPPVQPKGCYDPWGLERSEW